MLFAKFLYVIFGKHWNLCCIPLIVKPGTHGFLDPSFWSGMTEDSRLLRKKRVFFIGGVCYVYKVSMSCVCVCVCWFGWLVVWLFVLMFLFSLVECSIVCLFDWLFDCLNWQVFLLPATFNCTPLAAGTTDTFMYWDSFTNTTLQTHCSWPRRLLWLHTRATDVRRRADWQGLYTLAFCKH